MGFKLGPLGHIYALLFAVIGIAGAKKAYSAGTKPLRAETQT